MVLRQTKGRSVKSLIVDFKKDINSILIGTSALWHGIDVPGEALRSLFIYKIPYSRPDIPVYKARKEEIDNSGRSGYVEYIEPLAALELKQGFGRLIRKKTDNGIAIMLDENLINRTRIINSLPRGVNPIVKSQEYIIDKLKEISNQVDEIESENITINSENNNKKHFKTHIKRNGEQFKNINKSIIEPLRLPICTIHNSTMVLKDTNPNIYKCCILHCEKSVNYDSWLRVIGEKVIVSRENICRACQGSGKVSQDMIGPYAKDSNFRKKVMCGNCMGKGYIKK